VAMIECPECGKSISDQAENCPECGYPIKAIVHIESTVGYKSQPNINDKQKRLIRIGAVVLAVVLGCVLISQNVLITANERLAYENCKFLKNALKNPASFMLYDDIMIYPHDDDYDTLVYISYGGTNSYGGMVKSVAVFEETTYLGDYNDDKSDFDTLSEYDYFILARLPYKLNYLMNGNDKGFTYVNANKIMRKLS